MLSATTSSKPTRSGRIAREIADAIEDEIIFGVLRPLQDLAETPLMARFDAKRHVVRQALEILMDRQIVVKPANRSARVRDFSPREVRDLYQMREILQREAAMRLDFPNAAEFERIEALHESHIRACASGDLRRIHTCNDDFHSAIFRLCPNRILVAEIERFNQMTNAIRSLGIADPSLRARAQKEHSRMIAALAAQDRNMLAELVVQHIYPTCTKWLAQRSGLAGDLANIGHPDSAHEV